MQAVRRYQDTTGRRVSFEYSMVRGVNDSDACARQLANLIRGMGAHVNLIPINPVDGSPYSATDAANVRRFQQKLESLGVNATVRRRPWQRDQRRLRPAAPGRNERESVN